MMPDKSGQSQFQHLTYVEKMKRERSPEAVVPELEEYRQTECPDELYCYFKDFLELSKRRQVGEAGPLPLSWLEIKAWADLTKTDITPVALDVILRCDEVWLDVWKEKHPINKT